MLGCRCPRLHIIDWTLNVGIPYRARCSFIGLNEAAAQAGYGGALCPIHLKCKEVISPDANCPGRIETCNDSTFQFERRIGSILGSTLIGPATFIPAFLDMCGSDAGNRFDLCEKIVQEISPVGKHIQNDSTTVLLSVIPGGAL